MTTEFSQEDRITLEALDRLSREGEAALEEAKLVRESAELLALLPYELSPVEPRGEVWQRIEARLTARGERRTPTLVPFPRRAQSAAEDRPVSPLPVPVPISRPSSWGTFAMAATLALALLGLGYLLARTQYQQSTIEELRSDLTAVITQDSRIADHYNMVTRTARQYYPLQPASLSPREAPFYGRVWVCGRHQQWLLNVEGLKPAPAGYEYRFWFETEIGKVDGGAVEVRDGTAQLAAPNMPLGTRGFAVTLEARDSPHREPEGKLVLEGQEPREIVLGIEELGIDPKDLSM